MVVFVHAVKVEKKGEEESKRAMAMLLHSPAMSMLFSAKGSPTPLYV